MGSMRKSCLSQHKQGRLIELFVAGTTARTAARRCEVHRNTAAYYFLRLREIMAYGLEAESEAMFGEEIEVVTMVENAMFTGRILHVVILPKNEPPKVLRLIFREDNYITDSSC